MSSGANKNLIGGANARVEASSGLGIVKVDCAAVPEGGPTGRGSGEKERNMKKLMFAAALAAFCGAVFADGITSANVVG